MIAVSHPLIFNLFGCLILKCIIVKLYIARFFFIQFHKLCSLNTLFNSLSLNVAIHVVVFASSILFLVCSMSHVIFVPIFLIYDFFALTEYFLALCFNSSCFFTLYYFTYFLSNCSRVYHIYLNSSESTSDLY